MKKVINLQDLDCANCAAKMERSICKIEGVQSCSVNFLLQKMTLEMDGDNYTEILNKVKSAVKKVEPDCRLMI